MAETTLPALPRYRVPEVWALALILAELLLAYVLPDDPFGTWPFTKGLVELMGKVLPPVANFARLPERAEATQTYLALTGALLPLKILIILSWRISRAHVQAIAKQLNAPELLWEARSPFRRIAVPTLFALLMVSALNANMLMYGIDLVRSTDSALARTVVQGLVETARSGAMLWFEWVLLRLVPAAIVNAALLALVIRGAVRVLRLRPRGSIS